MKDAHPLIVERLVKNLERRSVELTPAQERPVPFDVYCKAYRRLFPDQSPAIERWRTDLTRRHGNGLTLCHYVIDIGPQSDGPTDCFVRENFAPKFGESFFVPSENADELAFARVFENVVPLSRVG